MPYSPLAPSQPSSEGCRVFKEPLYRVNSGLDPDDPDDSPRVEVTFRNCRLVLCFASGDLRGEGDIQELRLLPDVEGQPLKPWMLRRLVPDIEKYLTYGRLAMRQLEPEDNSEAFREAAETLRGLSSPGPGRGHPPEFFQNIAAEYTALVAEGEPFPVKAVGINHGAKISTASKWIEESRRRGYLPAKETKTDAS